MATLSFGVSATPVYNNFANAETTAGIATATGLAGSMFLVVAIQNNYPAYTFSVSDSFGNTYPATPSFISPYNSASQAIYAFASQGAATGGSGHTFSCSLSGYSSILLTALEIKSSVSSQWAVLDQSQAGQFTNVTTVNTPSITPTANGEAVVALIAGIGGTTSTVSDSGGFNNIFQSYTGGNANGAISGTIQATAAAIFDTFVLSVLSGPGVGTLSFKPYTGSSAIVDEDPEWINFVQAA